MPCVQSASPLSMPQVAVPAALVWPSVGPPAAPPRKCSGPRLRRFGRTVAKRPGSRRLERDAPQQIERTMDSSESNISGLTVEWCYKLTSQNLTVKATMEWKLVWSRLLLPFVIIMKATETFRIVPLQCDTRPLSIHKSTEKTYQSSQWPVLL